MYTTSSLREKLRRCRAKITTRRCGFNSRNDAGYTRRLYPNTSQKPLSRRSARSSENQLGVSKSIPRRGEGPNVFSPQRSVMLPRRRRRCAFPMHICGYWELWDRACGVLQIEPQMLDTKRCHKFARYVTPGTLHRTGFSRGNAGSCEAGLVGWRVSMLKKHCITPSSLRCLTR